MPAAHSAYLPVSNKYSKMMLDAMYQYHVVIAIIFAEINFSYILKNYENYQLSFLKKRQKKNLLITSIITTKNFNLFGVSLLFHFICRCLY